MECFTFYFKMIDRLLLFFFPYSPFHLIRTVKSGVIKYSRTGFLISLAWRSESVRACPRVGGDLMQRPLRLQPSSSQEHRCSCSSNQKMSKKEPPRSHDGQRQNRKHNSITEESAAKKNTHPLPAGLLAALGKASSSEDSHAKSAHREASRTILQFCGFHERSAGGNM